MFYFLLSPIMTYNFLLIAAAVIPAILLMLKVYRMDRLERESNQILWQLVKAGILSSLMAMVSERVLSMLLRNFVSPADTLYHVILYFGIVAFSEEGAKYLMLRRSTWNSHEFNCQYDGVVYAVFVSLGFALWENVSYVLSYGMKTALVRAITAIPGHACFGVFMGVFYAISKKYDNKRLPSKSKSFRILSVVIPALLHGAYDYIATLEQPGTGWFFVIFIAVLFSVSYITVDRAARYDRFI